MYSAVHDSFRRWMRKDAQVYAQYSSTISDINKTFVMRLHWWPEEVCCIVCAVMPRQDCMHHFEVQYLQSNE